MPARQIPISFPSQALSFDQIAISDSTRTIIQAIRRVERWPGQVFCIVGPEKSGLTTLLQAWSQERGGQYVDVRATTAPRASAIESFTPKVDLAIDRADLVQDDSALLLAISAAMRTHNYVLLSGRTPPTQWTALSADLRSRLKAAPIQHIPNPDETLLRGRLKQGFSKAYLHLSQNVEDYLVSRLGLDYSMVETAIDTLAGEAADRPVTIPLVRSVLGFADTEDPSSEE